MKFESALRLSCLLAMMVLSFGSGAVSQTVQPPLDTKPATIRFGRIIGVTYPNFIVAEDLGFFKGENLTIDNVLLNGSGAISEAMAANNVDMGETTPISSILATSKGGRTVALSGYEYTFTDKTGKPWEAAYVVVRSGEGIRNLEDLRGKRVAVNDYGSPYNYVLRANLLARGVNPNSDLAIVPIPFPQMAGALAQKQVDAIIAPADAYEQARLRIPVKVIGTHTSLEGLKVGISTVVGVSNQFLEKNPDAVVRFLRAMLKARLHMNDSVAKGNSEIKDIVAKNMKFTSERAAFFWNTRGGYYGKELEYVNMLDIPQQLVARQFEILKAVGLLQPDVSTEYGNVVDIRPLRRAYDSLGLKWDESKH